MGFYFLGELQTKLANATRPSGPQRPCCSHHAARIADFLSMAAPSGRQLSPPTIPRATPEVTKGCCSNFKGPPCRRLALWDLDTRFAFSASIGSCCYEKRLFLGKVSAGLVCQAKLPPPYQSGANSSRLLLPKARFVSLFVSVKGFGEPREERERVVGVGVGVGGGGGEVVQLISKQRKFFMILLPW